MVKKKFQRLSHRLQIGFNLVHSKFAQFTASYIKDKKVGKPVAAFFQVSHGLAAKKEYQSNWRAISPNPFSRMIGNLSIHHIHLSLMLFGQVRSSLFVESNSFKKPNPDSISILMHHKNNVQTHIFCSYATVFSKKYSIYFTNGLLEQTTEGLKLWTPRDSFGENGEYIRPPELELSQEGAERDTTLKRSIQHFIEELNSGNDLSGNQLLNAINASEEVLKLTSPKFQKNS